MIAEPPEWVHRARTIASRSRFSSIEWTPETGSTNADALAWVSGRGAASPSVFVADHQTAGRGRLDRTWVAPAGANLLVSVSLRPDCDVARWPLLTSAMALAVVDVAAGAGVAAGIRWPNDVIVEAGPAPGKLAGVLAEVAPGEHGPLGVVCGVGVNVAWPPDAATGHALVATSIVACGGHGDRGQLLGALLVAFDRFVRAVEHDPAVVQEQHRRHSVTLGRPVRIAAPDAVDGVAVDIDEGGRLAVDTDGGRRWFSAGDVTHLR